MDQGTKDAYRRGISSLRLAANVLLRQAANDMRRLDGPRPVYFSFYADADGRNIKTAALHFEEDPYELIHRLEQELKDKGKELEDKENIIAWLEEDRSKNG